jgi:hypothetical protein
MRRAWSKLVALMIVSAACSPRASSRAGTRPGQWIPPRRASASARVTAPPIATPAKRVAPVAAVDAEPKDARIDGDVAEWDVPAPVATSWSARVAVTTSGVTVAGRLADATTSVFVRLELGPSDAAPLVRTREGYRSDAACTAVFSGPALARCESSVRSQEAKLAEMRALLTAEYEVTRDGVRSRDVPLRASAGALAARDGGTSFELRIVADDLPWIGELPVRKANLGVWRTIGSPSVATLTLPQPVVPGPRSGAIAEGFWPAVGATTEAQAHVLALYRPSESAAVLRSVHLDGPPMGGGGPVPAMTAPTLVDFAMPTGRTLVANGDVEVQERVARGRRVVTSHKGGMAVGRLMMWDERTSKVRKTAIRSQGIDVLVEMVDPGEPGPPDNVALRVLRCGADGRVQTIVDFGNAFLKSERYEDATLFSFGVRGKGWRPREMADLDLRWIFDPATGTYTESFKGF